MILRKPYAFLIKNFKLIHLIFSAILCYIVFKIYNISLFFNEYIDSPVSLLTPEFVNETIPIVIIFLLFLLIIGYTIILLLMRYKKKPITFYFISILICFVSIILYYYVTNTFISLEINLIDVRTLKLNQDLINTMLILQSVCTVINIIRGIGFNFKKFDFSKDLEDLDIKANDNEEFEFNVEFEEGKFKRNLNKFKRNLKYVIIENKLLITISSIALFIIISGLIIFNIKVVNKVYKLGENVEIGNFSVTFNSSLYTNRDIYGNENKLKTYVLINFRINNMFGEEEYLEPTFLPLEINGQKFYHNKNYINRFYDLGVGYNKEKINNNPVEYMLIYEVPNSFINYNMYIVYKKDGIKETKIKVNPEKVEGETEIKEVNLGTSIDLSKTILKSGTLKINSYQVNTIFKNNYNYCIKENDCVLSSEYVYPSFSGNLDKALLKIEASFLDSKNKKINNFVSLLDNYGVIYYSINNSVNSIDNFNYVIPNDTNQKDVYYIEANRDIVNANRIWIEFNIREKIYKYYLK